MTPETIDSKGSFVKIGTRVRVLALPPAPAGLKKQELEHFNAMLGEVFEVLEIDEYGRAWVEKTWDAGSGKKSAHRLALRVNEMERVEG
jgi:hypothetical protein